MNAASKLYMQNLFIMINVQYLYNYFIFVIMSYLYNIFNSRDVEI